MYDRDKHYRDMLNSLEERSFSLCVNNKKMIGFNITDYVRLGYAYDFNLTHLQGYTSGTHELMLTIRFKTNNEQYKTPRFAEWD